MWLGLTRRPSPLRELLHTLQLLLGATQETNALLRELLINQGRTPRTPQLLYPQLHPSSPLPTPPPRSPSRVRTRNDVTYTQQADTPTQTRVTQEMDDPPDHGPEPRDG